MVINKDLIILVGPKGSGKTYIGNLIYKVFKIKYINAEKLLLIYLDNNPHINLPLPRHGFDIEIDEIKKSFEENISLIYDMTGTSEYTNSVIYELGNLYRLHLIKILCPLTCCMKRIKNRSVTDHFDMNFDSIHEINNRAINVKLNWNLEINNNENANYEEIFQILDDYFYKTKICPTKRCTGSEPIALSCLAT